MGKPFIIKTTVFIIYSHSFEPIKTLFLEKRYGPTINHQCWYSLLQGGSSKIFKGANRFPAPGEGKNYSYGHTTDVLPR